MAVDLEFTRAAEIRAGDVTSKKLKTKRIKALIMNRDKYYEEEQERRRREESNRISNSVSNSDYGDSLSNSDYSGSCSDSSSSSSSCD